MSIVPAPRAAPVGNPEVEELTKFLEDVPKHLHKGDLEPVFAFGCAGTKDSMVHIDEDTVAYTVGAHVVAYPIVDQKPVMKFLPIDRNHIVTIMAVSPARKLLAVAEKNTEDVTIPGTIGIYDIKLWRKMKTLSSKELVGEFIKLAFCSEASKSLVSLSSGIDSPLVLWDLEKGKIITMVKTEADITRVTVNPWDTAQFCTSGSQYMRFWKSDTTAGTLKGFNAVVSNKFTHQEYTDHCWLSRDVVIAPTAGGDLYIFDQGDLRSVLHAIHPGKMSLKLILRSDKGFIVAGEAGFVGFYEKTSATDEYAPTKLVYAANWQVPAAMSLATDRNILVTVFESGQVGYMDLTEMDSFKEAENNFKLVANGFHKGAITGLDIALRKPSLITCGLDRTVRLWNYAARTCDIVHRFHEEPTCVAIHPLGLDVAVGFPNRVYLFNVLAKDFSMIHEYPIKSCRECKFSNGGQYIAALSGSSLLIYSVYTYEHLATLKGHNGDIRDLQWSAADTHILTCGVDGAVYEWSIDSMTREDKNDHVVKACAYTACAFDKTSKYAVAAGSDRRLKVLVQGHSAQEISAGDSTLTKLTFAHSGSVMFAGTAAGRLLTYGWPLHSNADPENIPSTVAHAGALNRLILTPDDRFVFTAGADGSLFIFQFTLITDGSPVAPPIILEKYIDTFLISQQEMEDKALALQELEAKVSELKADIDFKLLMKDQQYKEIIAKKDSDFDLERTRLVTQYNQLRKQKELGEIETGERFSSLETMNSRAAEQLEQLYEEKFILQMSKYQELERDKADMECVFEEEFDALRKNYEAIIAQLKKDNAAKLERLEAKTKELAAAKDKSTVEYEEIIRQTMAEYEDEVEQVKDQASHALFAEQEKASNIKGEAVLMRKKVAGMKKELVEAQIVIRNKETEIVTLEKTIAHQDMSIGMLRRELREVKDSVAEKETQINLLKANIAELEKFKFVLDYKINELKREIEPRDVQIGEMKEQIREMDTEIEKDHRNSSKLELVIAEKNTKITSMAAEMQRVRHHLADKERVIESFARDVFVLKNSLHKLDAVEGISRLYTAYVSDEAAERNRATFATTREDAKLKEFARQRKFMETNVTQSKQLQKAVVSRERMKYEQKITENAALIEEISNLRRVNDDLNKRLSRLQATVSNQITLAGASSGGGGGSGGGGAASAAGSRIPSRASSAASAEHLSRTAPASRPSTSMTRYTVAASPIPPAGPGGRLIKGSTKPFELTANERSKMVEMLEIIEENNGKMEAMRSEIGRLRDQVKFLLERTPADALVARPRRDGSPGRDSSSHELSADTSDEKPQPRGRPASKGKRSEASKTPPPIKLPTIS